MDLEHLVLLRPGHEVSFLEADALLTAAVAEPPFAPGVFYQDTPHGFGRGGKEMAASLPVRLAIADEPQPGFMDQRSGLKRLAGGFLGHLMRRETAKFLIDQREQFRSGFGVTLLCAVQNVSDVAHACRLRKSLLTSNRTSFNCLHENRGTHGNTETGTHGLAGLEQVCRPQPGIGGGCPRTAAIGPVAVGSQGGRSMVTPTPFDLTTHLEFSRLRTDGCG